MRDWSRIAVFSALALLLVVLLARGPVISLGLGHGLRPLLLMALLGFVVWKVWGGGCGVMCGSDDHEAAEGG